MVTLSGCCARWSNWATSLLLLIPLVFCGCGGGGGSSISPAGTVTSVTVTTSDSIVLTGQRLTFTATVNGTGNFAPEVTWAVNGAAGGNAQFGTIDSGGNYVAPSALPTPNPITVTATSRADPTKSGTGNATIYTIAISPNDPSVIYGQTQQFTATVSGLSANPGVTWSALMGQISSSGLYSAPSQDAGPVHDTVSATLVGGNGSVSTYVALLQVPAKLDSISPSQAVVGETITLYTENLTNSTAVFFTLPGGVPVAANFSPISMTEITALVPVGATTGPVYVQYGLDVGGNAVTNSVNFTRLPNLHIRAQNKELSSGETMQFNWSFLGGTSSSPIEWTADQGTISPGGLYQAPLISSGEAFATVTGCISGTIACDVVMVHVLPFRIEPPEPVTALGGSVQLNGIQGGPLLSPAWSLPAADGQITSQGLFTAPTNGSKAGYIPVAASFGSTTENGSVAVSGGFPGIVNRVSDYIDFNNPGKLGMYTESVAVSGNYAYCVDLGTPFTLNFSYAAIDVYDITNPHEPVWVAAVDATSSQPTHIFAYGHYLFTVDSGFVNPLPSHISIYDIQNQVPVLLSVVNIPELSYSTVNNGVIYGFPQSVAMGSTTVPVYTFDVRTGGVIQNEYDLPPPSGTPGITTGFLSVTGNGSMIYASQANPNGSDFGLAVDAFDISTSPPTLVTWIPTMDGFQLQSVGQLVFADRGVYDFSTSPPTQVGDFSMISVLSVLGNQVVALGEHFNYLVIDVSNPTTPTLIANVADSSIENPDCFPSGALAGNNFFAAEGLGGLAVFDISAPGGPVNEPPNPFAEMDNAPFYQIFGQVIQSSTLYTAGATDSNGDGGLSLLDTSGSQPVVTGKLIYTNEYGLAVQVSGTNAFLGLNDKLKVVDITNATSPVEVGSVTVPINALALSGTTLFAGSGDSRLVVFDITTPAMPNQIASVSIPGAAVTMRVSGTLLFIADGTQGLLIFDVSQASAPVLLGQFLLSAPVWDVAPSGTTALLAADALGLVTADVSNPAQVKQLSQTKLPVFNPFPSLGTISSDSLAVSVAIQNDLVYVGTEITDPSSADALATFDFSQPTSPRLVAFRRLDLNAIFVVTPSGNNLFIADGGLVTEFDNSFPYNSVELYVPPAALAQSFPLHATRSRYSRTNGQLRARRLVSRRLGNFRLNTVGSDPEK